MRRIVFTALAAVLFSAAALAQSHQPYSGLRHRAIKALSDEQIADLRAGRGMGFALAAELNGYPGPVHVLEHAEALGLSPEQREIVAELHKTMQSEVIPLGETLIGEEAELDRLFRDGTVTPANLAAATERIGATQAALRATHLRYHLLTRDVLTPEQRRRYGELRGYVGGGTDHQGHSGQHGGH